MGLHCLNIPDVHFQIKTAINGQLGEDVHCFPFRHITRAHLFKTNNVVS